MSQWLERPFEWMADEFFNNESPWQPLIMVGSMLVTWCIGFAAGCALLYLMMTGLRHFGLGSFWHFFAVYVVVVAALISIPVWQLKKLNREP